MPQGAPQAAGVLGALQQFKETPTGQRWTQQNKKLVRADLGIGGTPVLARQGSMVLYQGKVDFSYKGAGFSGRLVGNATGQEMQLMRCTGQGQVFFAENSTMLHPIELQGDAVCVSAENVLAFDETLQYEVRRIEGHGIPGGALFTMQFQGTGTIVVKTHGIPVVLPVTPTHVRRRQRRRRVVGGRPGGRLQPGADAPELLPRRHRGERQPAVPGSARQLHRRPAVRDLREPVMNQPLAGYAPAPVTARMENHGNHMLKVAMQSGHDLLARVGSMVAYEGFVQYEPNPPAVRQIAKDWLTGEGAPLMKCSGDGLLYLADYGANVVVINLNGEGISVNATNLLAFDAHLTWGVERVKGLAKFAGQGLWNTKISGQGWVALTSRGKPIVVDCGGGEDETYVDPDALVAWSPNLKVKGKRSFRAQSLIGRGSGEAYQMAFSGQGIVVVQPSEDSTDRLRVRG